MLSELESWRELKSLNKDAKKATRTGAICSPFLPFGLPAPLPGEGDPEVCSGTPHTPDWSRGESPDPRAGRRGVKRGGVEARGRGGGLRPRGRHTEPWEPFPGGAAWAPPGRALPRKAEFADPASVLRGGSSPRQVLLGQTRPGVANHKRKSRGAGTFPP